MCSVQCGLEKTWLAAVEGQVPVFLCGLPSSLVALVASEIVPHSLLATDSSGAEGGEEEGAGTWRATVASRAEW